MPKAVETILNFLKSENVDTEGMEDSIKAKFADQVIADSDSVLSDGQVAVEKAKFDATEQDMMRYKKERNDLQKTVDELNDELHEDGEKRRRKIKQLQDQIDSQKPIVETFTKKNRERWDNLSDYIPEEITDHFKWPDSEDDQLSDADVNSNISKLDELVKLKSQPVLQALEKVEDPAGPGNDEQNSFRSPRGQNQNRRLNLNDLTPGQKMEEGFSADRKERGG